MKPFAVQQWLSRAIELRMEEHSRSTSPAEAASALSAVSLRELQDRVHSVLATSREQAARLETEITRQLDDLAAALGEQAGSAADRAADFEQQRSELARLTGELDAAQESWRLERIALEGERDSLLRQVHDLQSQHHSAHEEWRSQLLDFEARLREQQDSWHGQRAEWSTTQAGLERERDELQQKFQLALADVQRLRERIAELDHELARRPIAGQPVSAELVALRAERDALSQRVEELEQRPITPIDADVTQQMADLQRRFELAVEDVRELKTRNAKLESQLAAGSSRPPVQHDAGGMDWESQKRRLLATLEESSADEHDPELRQERATIKNTIEITDAVVAEKDRQLAELRAQFEAVPRQTAELEDARDPKINELIDADEVIAEHRRRAQQLEREMDEKLRAAELELSIERAKLARQKAELEELRANLDSQRQQNEAAGVAGNAAAPGTPRRRWLSKLGIDGKE